MVTYHLLYLYSYVYTYNSRKIVCKFVDKLNISINLTSIVNLLCKLLN